MQNQCLGIVSLHEEENNHVIEDKRIKVMVKQKRSEPEKHMPPVSEFAVKMIFIVYDISMMVFRGSIFDGAYHFGGESYYTVLPYCLILYVLILANIDNSCIVIL